MRIIFFLSDNVSKGFIKKISSGVLFSEDAGSVQKVLDLNKISFHSRVPLLRNLNYMRKPDFIFVSTA